MKIKNEHMEIIREGMLSVLMQYPHMVDVYKKNNLSDTQLRWDIFNEATKHNPVIIRKLYEYLNDNHIDTALKAIMKEIL